MSAPRPAWVIDVVEHNDYWLLVYECPLCHRGHYLATQQADTVRALTDCRDPRLRQLVPLRFPAHLNP